MRIAGFSAIVLPAVLAIWIFVVGAAKSAEKEILFPIVTHVGNHNSYLYMLNPSSKYWMRGELEERSPGRGGSHKPINIAPGSMSSSFPNWDFAGPGEWKRGWARARYHFTGVSEADKERVENLRLLAWTELILLERKGWRGDPTNPLLAVASIPAVEPALEFRVAGIHRKNPRAEGEPEAEAAIVILNPSEEPIQIEVTLFHYNNEEEVQVKNTLSVPPMDRLSRFLWELMTEGKDDPPERPERSSRSTLHIRGGAPIAVAALLYYPDGVFANLPVVRVGDK